MWVLCALALAGELPNEMTPGEALSAMSPGLGTSMGLDSRRRRGAVGVHVTFQLPDTPLSVRTSFADDGATTLDNILLVPFGDGAVVGLVGVMGQRWGPQLRHHIGPVLGLGLQGPKRKRVQPHAELTTNPMWSLRTGRSSHELRIRMGLTWSPLDPRSREGG